MKKVGGMILSEILRSPKIGTTSNINLISIEDHSSNNRLFCWLREGRAPAWQLKVTLVI